MTWQTRRKALRSLVTVTTRIGIYYKILGTYACSALTALHIPGVAKAFCVLTTKYFIDERHRNIHLRANLKAITNLPFAYLCLF